jgi:hypothetical protein
MKPLDEATRLTLSAEEARWLATAVTVLRRILQSVPSSAYRTAGLAVLHRIAEYLPPGVYPDVDAQNRSSNTRARLNSDRAGLNSDQA